VTRTRRSAPAEGAPRQILSDEYPVTSYTEGARWTPTTRTTKLLESHGWLVDICERRINRTLTRDLYGFADHVAIRGDRIMFVQSTSDSNLAARVKKCEEAQALPIVLAAGIWVIVIGWKVVDGHARYRMVML